jgi:hypothetical protein
MKVEARILGQTKPSIYSDSHAKKDIHLHVNKGKSFVFDTKIAILKPVR